MTASDIRGLEAPMHDVNEVARVCGVSTRTVWRWVAAGLIDYRRMGGLVRFTTTDVEDFVRRSRVKAVS